MVSQRRVWAKALAEFYCLWPRGCAVPGWGMAGPKQWNSWGTSDCSTGGRWQCWGFWQTWAASPPGNMFPILQFHGHLFHAYLAWWWRRISPRRAGLAWCPLVPEWAQLTHFLPSVKSAVFWIQVEVWECLATRAGIVLLCPCLRYHKWAAFPNRKLPLNACLTRAGRLVRGKASIGDTRQVCHLWWCLQRLSDEQQEDQMLPQSTSAQNNCWVCKWVGTSLPRPPGCCQSTTSIWWPTLLLSQHCLLPPLSQFLADAI